MGGFWLFINLESWLDVMNEKTQFFFNQNKVVFDFFVKKKKKNKRNLSTVYPSFKLD
jgi:hypothetical protein